MVLATPRPSPTLPNWPWSWPVPNFGIHEGGVFPPETRAVFPGCPETKEGDLYAHEAPGLGIDIDEKLAAKYPIRDDPPFDFNWGTTRRRDGTVIRP